MRTFRPLVMLSFIASLFSASAKKESYHTSCTSIKDGPTTLYIHGTIFPIFSRLGGHHMERKGLYHYSRHTHSNKQKLPLGSHLHAADPQGFPAAGYYKYYWPGNLNFEERKKTAREIFALLKDHKGPLTIIAHSHGCSVALYLSEYAQQERSDLSIDRLILLAPPVQQATAQLVTSKIFKRVYSFYSNGDVMQVADPQNVYKDSKKAKTAKKRPFFSERTFPSAPQLSQAQVLFRHKSPGHNDFNHPQFFKHIPALLHILDTEHKKGNDRVVVNIPHQPEKPHLVKPKKKSNRRGVDHCTCKNGRHAKRT